MKLSRLMKKISIAVFSILSLTTVQNVTAQEAPSNEKQVIWTKIEDGAQVQLIREGNHEYILRTPLEIVSQLKEQHISNYLGVPDYGVDYDIPEIQSDELIRSRLMSMNVGVPMQFTPQVRREIDRFLGDRRVIEESLGRAKYFIPIAEKVAANKPGVPSVFKYLPLVESNYKPNVRSRAGASGIWQFMRGTGRLYGLEVNSVSDHRMDPDKATEAAFTYLNDLHDIYDDWFLALAAYNCGPGRVNKAISYSGQTKETATFWNIQNQLPRETQRYVPKFIAAVYVLNFSDQIGLVPNWSEFENVRSQVEKIKTANYQQPVSNTLSASKAIPIPEDAKVLTYTVKSGDNLGFIADWYDVSTQQLRSWNNISGNLIKPGQKIEVHIPNDKAHIYSDIDKISKAGSGRKNGSNSAGLSPVIASLGSNRKFVNYTIQSGDTLWDISRKNGISIDEIKQLNNITNTRNLKPGMVIKIREKS